MASVWSAQIHVSSSFHLRSLSDDVHFRAESVRGFVATNWNRRVKFRKLVAAAVGSDGDKPLQESAVSVDQSFENEHAKKLDRNLVSQFREAVGSLPFFVFPAGKFTGRNVTIGFCIVATILVFVVRSYASRKSKYSRPGSVADLVRRGQLKSDRRGISAPLKYEDPFNNPMVKVSKNNSSVEMCGKVYRLAPVTLTGEQQSIHQKRRSRAYQWKRPTVFLQEGESVPPDVDPDTVRWIPANHPFATTSSDIDEGLAQNNVYQKNGVPFRIQAEHEALQRKLEALQNDQKLSKLVIDPAAARDFERSQKPNSKPEFPMDHGTSKSNSKLDTNLSASERVHSGIKPASEETSNP